MSVELKAITQSTRLRAAALAYDAMQPHATAWLEATLGVSDFLDFVVWFNSKVAAVAIADGGSLLLFVEMPTQSGHVVVHPFVRPDVRQKIALLRRTIATLEARMPGMTLVVRTSYRTSKTVLRLLSEVGFRYAGNMPSPLWASTRGSDMLERLPLEEWTILLKGERNG